MTGIFSVDGVDVAGLVAEHLGPRLLPAQLIKPGPPGGRDPANPTRVLPPGPPTEHGCRGFTEKFSDYSVAQGLVLASDRKVTILGGTLPRGVVPVAGQGQDRIRIEGKVWNVHRIIERDPAAATYVLQARDPSQE